MALPASFNGGSDWAPGTDPGTVSDVLDSGDFAPTVPNIFSIKDLSLSLSPRKVSGASLLGLVPVQFNTFLPD